MAETYESKSIVPSGLLSHTCGWPNKNTFGLNKLWKRVFTLL